MDHLSIFTLGGFTTLHSQGVGPLQDELLVLFYWLCILVMQPWKALFFKHIGGLGNVQRTNKKEKGEFIGCQVSSN
jgi:hypothetical protein